MIKSSPFGPTVLTGKDVERFLQHLNEDPPNEAAKASLARGKELLAQMDKQGFAIIEVNHDPRNS